MVAALHRPVCACPGVWPVVGVHHLCQLLLHLCLQRQPYVHTLLFCQSINRCIVHILSLSIESLDASYIHTLSLSIAPPIDASYTLAFCQFNRCTETHAPSPRAANLCSNSWNIMTIAYNFSVLFGLFSECWRPFGMRRKYVLYIDVALGNDGRP